MRSLPVLAVAAALASAGFALAGGSSTVRLTARLEATQERPAPHGAARGTGVFTATLSGRSLTWRLTFAHLTGRAVAAHIHLGRLNVAGPVAVPLCGPCASGVHGKVMLPARVRAALLAGGAYVNVHTPKNPAGEIRGQVAGPHGLMPAPPRTTATTATPPPTTTSSYPY